MRQELLEAANRKVQANNNDPIMMGVLQQIRKRLN